MTGGGLEWGALASALARQHGPVSRDEPLPLGNKPDPYDELVYILLTLMTRSQPRIDRAYEGLRSLTEGRGWAALLEIPQRDIRDVLEPLGFVNRRTQQLLGAIEQIERSWGGDLQHLEGLADRDAIEALIALPGVGVKTAKCVLMYSMGRDVFPVDVHVLRVLKRLGLLPPGTRWEVADRELEHEVPEELKFALHVQLVVHGRDVCRSRAPDCATCVLAPACPSAHQEPGLRADFL